MEILNEYPRPQLKRNNYLCLNGEWEYSISKNDDFPHNFDGKVLVPFSPETVKSGVNKKVSPNDFLYYKLEFNIPKEYINDKVLLHFGAIDQIAEVYFNENFLGKHVGGFLPFEFDIKPYIKEHNILKIKVKDVTDSSYFSRGKQSLKRGGIWYTQQSGIYMPVWLEGVSNDYIKKIKITPNIDKEIVELIVYADALNAIITLGNEQYICDCNKPINIKIRDMKLWSPENPYLYYFTVETKEDKVESYFAMRKFSVMKDKSGIKRLALNNKPYFMKGVLDQGYYKEGFLTPSCDEDYIKDISLIKEMGFNTLRKHIKIESLRWYYHCDRLGMIVWQDFVSGGEKYKFFTISIPLVTDHHISDTKYKKFGRGNEQGKLETVQEFKDTIELLYNSPSIGLWTIFNEGWGQFDSAKIYKELRQIDNNRLFDHASGWHDQGISDVKSLHVYFKRVKMPNDKKTKNRAIILSECGGYKLAIPDHTFSNKKFGYKNSKNEEKFIKDYQTFIEKDILKNIPKGLSAFIYTQLSDVEDELNGFITYDREVVKVNKKSISDLNGLVKY